MAAAKVYKADGSETGSVDLNDAVFDVPANPTLIKEVVVSLRNAQRQGNAETKVRKEVRGGGGKPYRQKGTGHARHGSTREPQMRG
ncbi:MAG: 50S ribosomal protein L4, partial [Candidatus Hydrogenedentes bacterium]|nr:50S ribosomal protein L4 [Candidatus Hydrogenedentota bacterium]